MGLMLLGASFLYLCMTGPMVTANIAVGATCSPSETCVTGAVCDKVHGKCLIGADATCTTASENNCVFGASCKDPTSGTFKCQCDNGFTENTNSKICEANVGRSCNKSVTCVSSSTCDAVFGKCLIEADATCTTASGSNCVFGASCKEPSSGTFKCQCDAGFTENTNSKICEANVGTSCNKSVTCVSSSTCDAVFGKCLIEADATCTTASGSNCVFGASCKEPTTGTFKCQCDAGFTENTNSKICEASVGISCNKSVTCVSSSTCDAVFGKCLLKKGQDCSGDNADNCVFGASCRTSCECGDGYTDVTDSKLCDPKNPGTVGTPCTSGGSECTTPNSVCSSLGACKCKTGSLLNVANGQCAPENKGSAAGQASMWLLSVTLMAMLMAVYVL